MIEAEERPVAYLIDTLIKGIVLPEELDSRFTGSVLDVILRKGTPPLSSSRCEINAVTASVDIAKAFGIQRGDVLLCFTAWLYTTSGQIIDYSYSYFLPGFFRFHVVRRVGKQP